MPSHEKAPDAANAGGEHASQPDPSPQSSKQQGHKPLTDKQWSRWAHTTVRGLTALPTGHQAFALASALGDLKMPGLRYYSAVGVEVGVTARNRVLGLAGIQRPAWDQQVRAWVEVGMAHRCRRGVVMLFREPIDFASDCPCQERKAMPRDPLGNASLPPKQRVVTETVPENTSATRSERESVSGGAGELEGLDLPDVLRLREIVAAAIEKNRPEVEAEVNWLGALTYLNSSADLHPPSGVWTKDLLLELVDSEEVRHAS